MDTSGVVPGAGAIELHSTAISGYVEGYYIHVGTFASQIMQ